ncbi:RNA-binding protein [Variovorax sp. HJSM1_2]|uniref:RNA-binding protein n=1 Tax=Variovorax sp. HJSM1_2 TaxID=3366263 RepID=UPI003BD42759
MSRLLLGNIAPGTTDDEVRGLLEKYGFPLPDQIEHAEGDGSRPAMLLIYEDVDATTLTKLQQRIHNLYWKRRKLNAMLMSDRFA